MLFRSYWHVTEDIPTLYPGLREAAERQGIPLYLREPESPAIPQFAPIVLLGKGVETECDYLNDFEQKVFQKL